MRALVTGGAGFIGSAIARGLLADGWSVCVLDNLSTGHADNVPADAELVIGDLRDLDVVRRATVGADIVFHQGAIRSVARSVDEPISVEQSNSLGTMHVLISAHEAGTQRVIYASSSSVYGDIGEGVNDENLPANPVSPYAVSKLAGELYCRVWTHLRWLSTLSLRYFNVFGPGQPAESKYAAVFPAFISALIHGYPPEVHWDGKQTRDFTYIDDVVRANILAAQAGPEADSAVMNIAGGKAHSVNEVLRAVSAAVGRWIEPTRAPKRPGDVRRTRANTARARQLLGWEPTADWDESVRATVEWFRRPDVSANPP